MSRSGAFTELHAVSLAELDERAALLERVVSRARLTLCATSASRSSEPGGDAPADRALRELFARASSR